jgi:hypothetical protein
VESPRLTLRVDCSALCCAEQPYIEVIAPDGKIPARDACQFNQQDYRHRVTVPVMNGHYTVRRVGKQS